MDASFQIRWVVVRFVHGAESRVQRTSEHEAVVLIGFSGFHQGGDSLQPGIVADMAPALRDASVEEKRSLFVVKDRLARGFRPEAGGFQAVHIHQDGGVMRGMRRALETTSGIFPNPPGNSLGVSITST